MFYGEKQALFDVSFDIFENEVTALIGPSGCGKSTYLRTLNRMNDTIDICRVNGRPSNWTAPMCIRMTSMWFTCVPASAWCFKSRIRSQNRFTTMSLTGHASTASPPANKRVDAIVEESLTKRAGLWKEVKDRLDEAGTGLSGGQQQRLCDCPRHRRPTGSDPDGRAVLGTGSDCDGAYRRVDRRATSELHHRHCDPLNAASRPRFATHGILSHGVSWSRLVIRTKYSPRPTINAPKITLPADSAE